MSKPKTRPTITMNATNTITSPSLSGLRRNETVRILRLQCERDQLSGHDRCHG